ncbi:hypothetical protein M409DRAFT_70525 [Zasmidium cellare ATCC 36951]|uniref:Thioesterase domain-containing protein n=1 Tax=Zasmidium cellare ATCC 36951 TaxID=1080233 RepID=A0A6A6C2G3_ZASCE|nr:uncharacterized protein M409DRAFT_70525 [Zasmidium cellare ATCC 36951]KAF2160370.1 hypothetical protein M409DRAFT_70525 [Zasmidium cellare ATCC 36951]
MIPKGEGWNDKYFAITTNPSFAKLSPEERINAVLSVRAPHDVRFLSQFFEQDCKLHSFKQTSPTTSTVTFRFTVTRFYCNAGGGLHGAAQSLIYDHLTSLAIQAVGQPGGWLVPGVSRSLNVTYLRPAPEGTICLCECEVMAAGKGLALMRGVIRRELDGKVISTCEHDKAFVATQKL